MTYLLYVITFTSNICITYLPDNGAYYDTFDKYMPETVDVYNSIELSDKIGDKLFTKIYHVDNMIIQCQK